MERPRGSATDAPVHYSVVVPVYKSQSTLKELTLRLEELQAELPAKLEVVFVSDGSPDDSAGLLRELLPDASFTSRLIVLSRNYGAFAAIRSGLAAARGRYIAVMAADMQEPPALIKSFFELLASGDFDVTVGRRTGRQDSFFNTLMSRVFWFWYRRLVMPEMPPGGVDIFGCTAEVRDSLITLRESNSSLIGLLFWLGFRRAEVPYERLARTSGKSTWTFGRKLRYLLDSAFSFTHRPITLLTGLGVVGLVGSVVASIVVFTAWAAGDVSVPGYAPLMLTILTFNSALLLGLGVVGSYVWRTYENTKLRPIYVPMFDEQFAGRAN